MVPDSPEKGDVYLESQPGPNFVGQDFGDHPVEGRQDLHCQLRLDATFVDQIIKGIGQGQAETRRIELAPMLSSGLAPSKSYLLPR